MLTNPAISGARASSVPVISADKRLLALAPDRTP